MKAAFICVVILRLAFGSLAELSCPKTPLKTSEEHCPASMPGMCRDDQEETECKDERSTLLDSWDDMICKYEENDWNDCLSSLSLSGGPTNVHYTSDSVDPKAKYYNASCTSQSTQKEAFTTQIFIGMPKGSEYMHPDCELSAFGTVSDQEWEFSALNNLSDCCFMYTPKMYSTAKLSLIPGLSEQLHCCCKVRLDAYVIWGELAFLGVPRSSTGEKTTLHYFPQILLQRNKIGRLWWNVNSYCHQKPVYAPGSGSDDVAIGLRTYMENSAVNVCQALAMARKDLSLIFEFRFGVTLVVAVNQYCYKGGDLNKWCISQLPECIQKDPHVSKSLASTQVFYSRTVHLDGYNVTSLDPGNAEYKPMESDHMECLRKFATDKNRLDIMANGIGDVVSRQHSKIEKKTDHLDPLTPNWWDSTMCPTTTSE